MQVNQVVMKPTKQSFMIGRVRWIDESGLMTCEDENQLIFYAWDHELVDLGHMPPQDLQKLAEEFFSRQLGW